MCLLPSVSLVNFLLTCLFSFSVFLKFYLSLLVKVWNTPSLFPPLATISYLLQFSMFACKPQPQKTTLGAPNRAPTVEGVLPEQWGRKTGLRDMKTIPPRGGSSGTASSLCVKLLSGQTRLPIHTWKCSPLYAEYQGPIF